MDLARRISKGVRARSYRSLRLSLLSGVLAVAGIAVGGSQFIITAQEYQVAPQTLRSGGQMHDLMMGTAVESARLSEKQYVSTLSSEYSELEPENEMKFEHIHPKPTTYNYSGPDALIAFAQANSMKVRGHTLVWHDQLPHWITARSAHWTPSTLNNALAEHIANVVGHYKGKVYAWDVVNEPFNDDGTLRKTIWYDSPGIGFAGQGTKYIEQALTWAHTADPNAKLFVNEFGAEAMNKKSDAVYAMAKDLVQRGVPLSGIGFQLHVDLSFDSQDTIEALDRNIMRLEALGLEVHFTEVDVRLQEHDGASLAAQARAYQHLLDVCLKHTACRVFQTWGFTDKYSWIPDENPGYGWALPFDKSYKKKPAYFSLLKSLQ